jgi:hypothetical protein
MITRRDILKALGALGILAPMPSIARNVTWAELFSNNPPLEYGKIIAQWAGKFTVNYEIAPIGISALGSIFFSRRDGTVHCIDPLLGTLRRVAKDMNQFGTNMNTEQWQIENLHSKVVAQIVATGLERPLDKVYALAPHPHLIGGIDLKKSKVMVMDAFVWHSISAQSF